MSNSCTITITVSSCSTNSNVFDSITQQCIMKTDRKTSWIFVMNSSQRNHRDNPLSTSPPKVFYYQHVETQEEYLIDYSIGILDFQLITGILQLKIILNQISHFFDEISIWCCDHCDQISQIGFIEQGDQAFIELMHGFSEEFRGFSQQADEYIHQNMDWFLLLWVLFGFFLCLWLVS